MDCGIVRYLLVIIFEQFFYFTLEFTCRQITSSRGNCGKITISDVIVNLKITTLSSEPQMPILMYHRCLVAKLKYLKRKTLQLEKPQPRYKDNA